MTRLDKLNRALEELCGGSVRAQAEEDGCVRLTGSLDNWEKIVQAGYLAARGKKWRGVLNDIRFTGQEIPPMRTPALQDNAIDGAQPDVLVIGAGIVGCAIARELRRYDLDVLLVEKEHDVAMQTSSRNDGMVHPGIDLKRGQLKQRYNARGNAMYDALCRELGVKFKRCGQYLCFEERAMRPAVLLMPLYFRLKGIPCRYLGEQALHQAVPGLSSSLRFALFFPTAGTVCPYGLTIAYAENAVQNGARLSLDTAVLDMQREGRFIRAVQTNRGTVYPKVVVNAAGVFSDRIAEMAGDRFFTIHPRRGTNSILDKRASESLHDIVSTMGALKTRSAHTKGGGIVLTADGNLLVGPDAVETWMREDFSTDAAGVRAVFDRHSETSPQVKQQDLIASFSGVRAATYEEDFYIARGIHTHNIVHAAGIQSPGLTAAPAIAVDVASMAAQLVAETRAVGQNPNFDPVRIPIPLLREMSPQQRDQLIAQNPDYGEIICRCEEVSRGEVLDALRRPVPCDTVDGVKRRVRAGMGRCQGGFCGPLVAGIIAQELGIPLEQVTKKGRGSELTAGRTKGGGSL